SEEGCSSDLKVFSAELKLAEAGVVAKFVPARHQRDARGRAERMRVSFLKARAPGRHPVNGGRLIRSPAVGADGLIAQVVGQNQDDVGAPALILLCLSWSRICCCRQQQAQIDVTEVRSLARYALFGTIP